MKQAKEIKTTAEGVQILAQKNGIVLPPCHWDSHTLYLSDRTIPLFPWRLDGRFAEMKAMMTDGTLGNLCSIRAMCTAKQAETLEEILYREIDLCLWWADQKPVNVFAVVNDLCANVIMRFESNADMILEAAATLPDGMDSVQRHEIFTDHGTALDQAVDTLLKQHSIYKYIEGKVPEAITDSDPELYGLVPDDASLVRCVYTALTEDADPEEARKRDAFIRKITAAIQKSSVTQSVIDLREVTV